MAEIKLPALITMEQCGNDWEAYLEAVYQCFKADFLDSKPGFCGQKLSLKRYPVERGKEATFWHFTQEGDNETDRIPNFRRCERIPWIRPIIEGAGKCSDLRIWDQIRRKGERRIAIALPDFSYIVIVSERNRPDGSTYHLPWTAFPVEHEHQRRKYAKQWADAGPCKVLDVVLKD